MPTECTVPDPYKVEPALHRWSSQKAKEMKTKMLEPRFPRRYITGAMVQRHGPYPGYRSCHELRGGHSDACRSRFGRTWADEDSIKATAEAEAEKDARQASSSATTTVNSSAVQPASGTRVSSSQPHHQASSSSAADTTTSAAADQAAERVFSPSAPSKTAPWAVLAEHVLCNPSQLNRLGWDLDRRDLRLTHRRPA